MVEILIGVIFSVVIWRVLVLLGVSAQTAEIVLLLLLVVVVLGDGGLYATTGHPLFIGR